MRRNDRIQHAPIVVFTAHDLGEADRRRLQLGETAFLTKGRATPKEFEDRVIGLLGQVVPAPVGLS